MFRFGSWYNIVHLRWEIGLRFFNKEIIWYVPMEKSDNKLINWICKKLQFKR